MTKEYLNTGNYNCSICYYKECAFWIVDYTSPLGTDLYYCLSKNDAWILATQLNPRFQDEMEQEKYFRFNKNIDWSYYYEKNG